MTYISSLPGTEKGIIFLPNYSKNNPYQYLLYNAINKNTGLSIQGFHDKYFDKKLLDLHKAEYRYLHIHWLHPFFDLENDDVFNSFIEKIRYAKKISFLPIFIKTVIIPLYNTIFHYKFQIIRIRE